MGKINGKTYNSTIVPAGSYIEGTEVDAELTISPNKQWEEPAGTFESGTEYKDKMVAKSRASIVLHEFLEIVRRTLDGCGYLDAHGDAASEEENLPDSTDPRRSRYPGVGK